MKVQKTLYDKIVNKHSDATATLEEAMENPRKYAVSFSRSKNTSLHFGRDKNDEPVQLKYRGGFYFPFDKLERDLCWFGGSFYTQKKTASRLEF